MMQGIAAGLIGLFLATPGLRADACSLDQIGEGRVSAVVDGRTLRLGDGREVLLNGVEAADPQAAAALRDAALDRDVTLHGSDDGPDRYGRQPAIVYLRSAQPSLQALLIGQGMLLASGAQPAGCTAAFAAAEADARTARRGLWQASRDPAVIKNAESTPDILSGLGQFALIEGRVLSVREAGATVYLNFGRRWTRDFAVTIPKRALPAFEAAGLQPKSLENRRVRVRGWVDSRGGPRIEAVRAGQIELVDRERGGRRTP